MKMRVFTLNGANHYCSHFQPGAGIFGQSPSEFIKSKFRNNNLYLREGTILFDEFRSCSLRDAERSLFLAASHYRRAHDLMVPSSSHWAHVTLYYGAWFAAHALLAMFGCTVASKVIIEVDNSLPHHLVLQRKSIRKGLNSYFVKQKGSHAVFWEAFYNATRGIVPFVDGKYSFSLEPISKSEVWLIKQRNSLNYEGIQSISLQRMFELQFCEAKFPNCLPGALNTQYQVCQGILAASFGFAHDFGLSTDALDTATSTVSLGENVCKLVFEANIPDLNTRTSLRSLFAQ